MTPTNELRFVEREVNQQLTKSLDGKTGDTWERKTIRVLQQKWMQTYGSTDDSGTFFTAEDWRDVPLAKDET